MIYNTITYVQLVCENAHLLLTFILLSVLPINTAFITLILHNLFSSLCSSTISLPPSLRKVDKISMMKKEMKFYLMEILFNYDYFKVQIPPLLKKSPKSLAANYSANIFLDILYSCYRKFLIHLNISKYPTFIYL